MLITNNSTTEAFSANEMTGGLWTTQDVIVALQERTEIKC